ncbi:MAG: type I methionyl aminopeptidase [Pseudomonadota bacterium]
MIMLRNQQEIDRLRRSNQLVAEAREMLRGLVRPGMTTGELDDRTEEFFRKKGARSAFKGYRGYPKSICTSINEQVVHGIPGSRKLKEGDVLSLDIGAVLDGYFGDTAVTVPVGAISKEAARLLKVTEESLYVAIEAIRPDGHLNDIGAAVQHHVEAAGYSVVRDFVGHGIGQSLHEEPQIPNFGVAGTGVRLKAGMVLAIEPMVNEGKAEVKILPDGWTAVTADGRLSAHFEHSVAVTDKAPIVLSA